MKNKRCNNSNDDDNDSNNENNNKEIKLDTQTIHDVLKSRYLFRMIIQSLSPFKDYSDDEMEFCLDLYKYSDWTNVYDMIEKNKIKLLATKIKRGELLNTDGLDKECIKHGLVDTIHSESIEQLNQLYYIYNHFKDKFEGVFDIMKFKKGAIAEAFKKTKLNHQMLKLIEEYFGVKPPPPVKEEEERDIKSFIKKHKMEDEINLILNQFTQPIKDLLMYAISFITFKQVLELSQYVVKIQETQYLNINVVLAVIDGITQRHPYLMDMYNNNDEIIVKLIDLFIYHINLYSKSFDDMTGLDVDQLDLLVKKEYELLKYLSGDQPQQNMIQQLQEALDDFNYDGASLITAFLREAPYDHIINNQEFMESIEFDHIVYPLSIIQGRTDNLLFYILENRFPNVSPLNTWISFGEVYNINILDGLLKRGYRHSYHFEIVFDWTPELVDKCLQYHGQHEFEIVCERAPLCNGLIKYLSRVGDRNRMDILLDKHADLVNRRNQHRGIQSNPKQESLSLVLTNYGLNGSHEWRLINHIYNRIKEMKYPFSLKIMDSSHLIGRKGSIHLFDLIHRNGYHDKINGWYKKMIETSIKYNRLEFIQHVYKTLNIDSIDKLIELK